MIIEDYKMETRDRLYERFEHYKRPEGVNVVGHYQLLGQQRIVIICEAESGEALARITAPWTDLVSMQIFPAMAWADYYKIAYLDRRQSAGA
ncbi:MAG: DUF3303 domain-containing protein [Candidatus Limnocylindria bacterium]